ncbi:hypothetical protein LXL04_037015 [Taraxacum kok-saghyz]
MKLFLQWMFADAQPSGKELLIGHLLFLSTITPKFSTHSPSSSPFPQNHRSLNPKTQLKNNPTSSRRSRLRNHASQRLPPFSPSPIKKNRPKGMYDSSNSALLMEIRSFMEASCQLETPIPQTSKECTIPPSMLLRDLQSVVVYDSEGKFAGTDPGVPIVYAGFDALMLTTCISYLSHTHIWAIQDGTTVVVAGKTNRAKTNGCLLTSV